MDIQAKSFPEEYIKLSDKKVWKDKYMDLVTKLKISD